ncbi:alpha/beta hydrolase [Catellatospora sp. NPDC049609]|uniref:alpha/beta fold hydrolase n=1 Tax=Catellatospora sp. NPDC049609 TaxID=3155505 RepID=UPI00341A6E91
MEDVIARALSALVPGGVTRGATARGDRELRWIEAGTGAPTVVLDAASGTAGLTWAPVLPALAAHTRVVAYDRAGLGASDPAPALTLASQLDDLTALLDETGGGPCVLVGNSWGGLLAQLAAWSRPDLVAGLVLVDPAHEQFRPWLISAVEGLLNRLFAGRRALGLADRSLREQAVAQARAITDDPAVQALLVDAELACWAQRHQIRTGLAEGRMIAAQIPEFRRMRARSRFADIPVVVLSATTGIPAGMRARWTAWQAGIAAAAHRGEHVQVPDAGHYIHQSRPEVVVEAILGVVAQSRRAG